MGTPCRIIPNAEIAKRLGLKENQSISFAEWALKIHEGVLDDFDMSGKPPIVEGISEGEPETTGVTHEQTDKNGANDRIDETKKSSKKEKIQKEIDELFAERERRRLENKLGNKPHKAGFIDAEDMVFAVQMFKKQLQLLGEHSKENIQKAIDFISDKFGGLTPDEEAILKDSVNADPSGVKKEITDQEREDLDLEEFDRTKKTNEKLSKEADEWILNGGNIDTLLRGLERTKKASDVEVVILSKYKASLEAKINKGEGTPELLEQQRRILDLLPILQQSAGRGLNAFKWAEAKIDNLSNFLYDAAKAKGVPLTPEEIAKETSTYEELQKLKAKLADMEKAEAERFTKQQAEEGYKKARANSKKQSKKTHEQYVEERTNLLEQLKEAKRKLKGETNVTFPGVPQLKAYAPIIKKLAQSYANEGIDSLDLAVDSIYNFIKDELKGISKQNITDILGGEYDDVKPSKNRVQNNIQLILKEAELLKKIRDEQNRKVTVGHEETKKTIRIKELEEQLKEVRKENRKRDKEMDEPLIDKGLEMDMYEQRLREKAKKLNEDIKSGKYKDEPIKKTKPTLSYDAKKLKDQVVALEKTIRLKRFSDKEGRTKAGKLKTVFKDLSGLRRVVQTAIDWSVLFRQLVRVSLNPRHLVTTAKIIKAQAQNTFSVKKFDALINDLYSDPDFYNKKEDGIIYNDLNTGSEHETNEDYPKSFIYKIPIIGHALLGSNRGADSALNTARYELYNKKKAWLEKRGIFRNTHPQEYKDMGNWVMNMTGRGKLIKGIEGGKFDPVLGNTFYGARLMASHFNTLNPNSYGFNLGAVNPKSQNFGKFNTFNQAKKDAIYDMVGYASGIATTSLAVLAAGGTISLDPDDPDFLQARFGDKVYDITGGQAAYLRTMFRWFSVVLAAAEGKSHAEKADKFDFAFESTTRFLRNKLSPNLSYATNFMYGKNTLGQDFNPYEIFEIYPMYADDVIKGMQEEGSVALATVLLPNLIGVGYGSYANKADREPALKPFDPESEIYKIRKKKDKMLEEINNAAKTKMNKELMQELHKERNMEVLFSNDLALEKKDFERVEKLYKKLFKN